MDKFAIVPYVHPTNPVAKEVFGAREAIVYNFNRVKTQWLCTDEVRKFDEFLDDIGSDDNSLAEKVIQKAAENTVGSCDSHFTTTLCQFLCAIMRIFSPKSDYSKSAAARTKTKWLLCACAQAGQEDKQLLLIEPQLAKSELISRDWFDRKVRQELPPLTARYEWAPVATALFGSEPVSEASLWATERKVTAMFALRYDRRVEMLAAQKAIMSLFGSDLSTRLGYTFDGVFNEPPAFKSADNSNTTDFRQSINNCVGDLIFATFGESFEPQFKKLPILARLYFQDGASKYVYVEPSQINKPEEILESKATQVLNQPFFKAGIQPDTKPDESALKWTLQACMYHPVAPATPAPPKTKYKDSLETSKTKDMSTIKYGQLVALLYKA